MATEPSVISQALLGTGLTTDELANKQRTYSAAGGALLGLLGAGLTTRKQDGLGKTLARLAIGTAAGGGIGYGAAVAGQELAKTDNPGLLLGSGAALGGLALLAGRRIYTANRNDKLRADGTVPPPKSAREKLLDVAGWTLLGSGATAALASSLLTSPAGLRQAREWTRQVNDTDLLDPKRTTNEQVIDHYSNESARNIQTRILGVPAGVLLQNSRLLNQMFGQKIALPDSYPDHYHAFTDGPLAGRLALYREESEERVDHDIEPITAAYAAAAKKLGVQFTEDGRYPEMAKSPWFPSRLFLDRPTQERIEAEVKTMRRADPALNAVFDRKEEQLASWIRPDFYKRYTSGVAAGLKARDNAVVYGTATLGTGAALLAGAKLLHSETPETKRKISRTLAIRNAMDAFRAGQIDAEQLRAFLNEPPAEQPV